MAAGLAETLFFVSFLAAEVIIGFWVAIYAGHSFLVVVQDTAAGSDEVHWPDEPFLDWVAHCFYLGWIGGTWLAPVGLALHWLEAPVPTVAAVAAGAAWLFLPVGLLSSLGAGSGWVVFRPGLLWQMLRRPIRVLWFYVLTAVVLLPAAALAGFSLWHELGWWLLVPAAATVAAVWLIYARLLGRLAWLLEGNDQPGEEAPAPATVAAATESPPAPPPALEGYSLLPDLPELPPALEKANGNGHAEHEAAAAGSSSRIPWLAWTPRPRRRLKRRPRYQPGAPPRYPFASGVFSFPFYIESLRAWLTLSFGCLLLGLFARLMALFWPA